MSIRGTARRQSVRVGIAVVGLIILLFVAMALVRTTESIELSDALLEENGVAGSRATPTSPDREADKPLAPRSRVAMDEDLEEIQANSDGVLIGRCVAAEDDRPLANCEIYLVNVGDSEEFAPPMQGLMRDQVVGGSAASGTANGPENGNEGPANTNNGNANKGLAEADWIRPIDMDRFFMDQEALNQLRKGGKIYQRMPDARTDAEGRFRFKADFARALAERWFFLASSPGRLPHRRLELRIPRGSLTDIGDIALHRGWRLQGHVVNATGEGVVGATVWVAELPGFDEDGWVHPIEIDTQAGGWFAFSDPVPEGRWLLTVTGPGISPYSEWFFMKDQDQDKRIVIQERPSISGILLHRNGSIAAGIYLTARSSDHINRGLATSDDRGRFTILASDSTLPPVQIFASSHDMEMLHEPPSVEWGTSGLRLTITPQKDLDLLLRDAKTGALISGEFEVDEISNVPDGEFHYEEKVVNGRLQLFAMYSGRQTLRIGSKIDGWQYREIEIDVPRGRRSPIEVLMHKTTRFTVMVLDDHNEPVRGARILITEPTSPGMIPADSPRLPESLLRERTAEDGKIVLDQLPPGKVVDVHVSDRVRAPTVRRRILVSDSPQSLTVRLVRGGRVEGRITPAPGRDRGWTLMLVEPTTGYRQSLWIRDSGLIVEDPVPAGHYQLYLHAEAPRGKRLADLTVQAGQIHELKIHAPAPEPAKLTLTFDGLPPSHGSWEAWPTGVELGPGFYQELEKFSPGQTIQMKLPAGTWRFVLLPISTPGTQVPYYQTTRDLVLTAGQTLQTHLAVRAATTQLRILHPNGSPATRTHLELQYCHPGFNDWRSHLSLRTNDKGALDLQQLTPWPMRLLIPGAHLSTIPQRWTGQKKMTLKLKKR